MIAFVAAVICVSAGFVLGIFIGCDIGKDIGFSRAKGGTERRKADRRRA